MAVNNMKRRAFTLMEMLVAVGLLAGVILVSGLIFNQSLEAHRKASATAEIMRNLRAITEQIDADFRGWRTAIAFVWNSANNINADSVAFFSDGGFQTVRADYSGQSLRGNMAAICYAQAAEPNVFTAEPAKKILCRRVQVFTAERTGLSDPPDFDRDEYRPENSLASWVVKFYDIADTNLAGAEQYLMQIAERPVIDSNHPDYMHTIMCKGVDDFQIQFNGYHLYDPNHSQFDSNGELMWRPRDAAQPTVSDLKQYNIYALKFSFTLYDSKGIFKQGKRFSHIVYLRER